LEQTPPQNGPEGDAPEGMTPSTKAPASGAPAGKRRLQLALAAGAASAGAAVRAAGQGLAVAKDAPATGKRLGAAPKAAGGRPGPAAANRPAAQTPSSRPEPASPDPASPAPRSAPAERPAPRLTAMPLLKPIAGPARMRRRHFGLLATFGLIVVLPSLIAAAYLWLIADDQYSSTVAFSVRKEEFESSMDLIGGITKLTGSSTSDTDILYEYILSQDIVAQINGEMDLAAVWSKSWPGDPVFAYDPDGTIEDLTQHWTRKVRVTYDTGTGLISLRVLAFTPEDAKAVAEAVYARSSQMINDLSAAAREDAIKYAKEELDHAVERLKLARQELTAFRVKTQIVDPEADLQGQMGVLNTLQAQLAEALVEQDLIRETTSDDDPRVSQVRRRIAAIEARIADERRKFGEAGSSSADGDDYATLVAEFERLAVDMQFAEESYRSALLAHDTALADAQRQSRYLAAHIRPTVAERSLYPERGILLGLTTFFLLMVWAIGALVYYSVRDRR
jgi:capsular polysaccharide transport system permease protein